MRVDFQNAHVYRGGKDNHMLVANDIRLFKVYWCDEIKHYRIKEIAKHENQSQK